MLRTFGTGAIRDDDHDKLQFTRCLSPLVLERYAEFIRKHNSIEGGKKRREDNWKKGFTRKTYLESKGRHFILTWKIEEGYIEDLDDEQIIESLCAEFFNTNGYLHTLLVKKLEKEKEKVETEKKSWLERLIVLMYLDQESWDKILRRQK